MHGYHFQGCPKLIRADLGTENCTMANIQIAFRINHADASHGFIYGPSTANIVNSTVSYVNICAHSNFCSRELKRGGRSGDVLLVIGG